MDHCTVFLPDPARAHWYLRETRALHTDTAPAGNTLEASGQ